MTKSGVSRGRGPRVREDELERMLALYKEGKSFDAIAKDTGRHWQTVRKYTIDALKDRQGNELRKEAFRDALAGHYRDLVQVLDYLPGESSLPQPGEYRAAYRKWQPPALDRRARLLLQGLKEGHARDSAIWSWWESWNEDRQAYAKGLDPLDRRVNNESKLLGESSAGTLIIEPLKAMLMERGTSLASGSPRYDPSMLEVRPSSKANTDELWLGQSFLLGEGKPLNDLLKELKRSMGDMSQWPEVKELTRIYVRLADTGDRIAEEVEVLRLRRVFPGRCRLCPV